MEATSPSAANSSPGVLLLAHPRDASLTSALLAKHGAGCQVASSGRELLGLIDDDTGALILAEEMLTRETWDRLRRLIEGQPAWSDLPIVLVSGESQSLSLKALAPLGNVAVLRRPMDAEALISAASAALRARSRQFEVRDLLAAQSAESDRKDQFMSMLAHELRNPLAPVRYAAHLLSSDSAPAEERAKLAALIERQVSHMGHIIDQLLDASRLARGLAALDSRVFDFAALAREAVAASATHARSKGISLSGPAGGAVLVDGNPTRLRQAIDNLLDNAIKFSHEGGQVSVTVGHEGGLARLQVADQGDGFDEGAQQHLFEAFVQADTSLARSEGGLGLGLAIARGVAQLHGGDVRGSSPGRGRGSVFALELPAAQCDAAAESASAPASPATRGSASSARGEVLVAEDNVDAAEALRMLLETDGYTVHVVHSGPAAVEALGALRPDALVCDIGLPGLSGYDVARSTRSSHRPKVMVAVTGYAGPEARQLAREAGFDRHMAKPVAIGQLLEAIGQALRSARAA